MECGGALLQVGCGGLDAWRGRSIAVCLAATEKFRRDLERRASREADGGAGSGLVEGKLAVGRCPAEDRDRAARQAHRDNLRAIRGQL